MSFEQTASGEWHFPSPNATPHNNRFSFPPHQSPTNYPVYSPVNPQGPWMQGPPGSAHQRGSPPMKSSYDSSQFAGARAPHSGPNQHKPQDHGNYTTQPSPRNGSFVTSSFVQQFDDANLHSSMSQSHFSSDGVHSQMQTPPPTRHTDAKRKPQQPTIEFTTPSTIVSRRMSTPNGPNGWQGPNQPSFTDSSPFPISPLQFFNTGPLTAPVQSQSNFWEPSAFYSSPINQSQVQQGAEFWSSPPAYQPIVPSSVPHDSLGTKSSQPHQIARPHTAGPRQQPHLPSNTLQAPPVLLQSHVDPSLISKPESLSAGPIASQGDTAFGNRTSDQRQPSQQTVDSSKGDKDHERIRKAVRVTSLSSNPPRPVGALRRSATDSRSRRNTNSSNRLSLASSSDLQELTHDLQNAHIIRKNSPLKRQRSDTQSSTGSSRRKSVILKIDENGYASTEVQMVDDGARSRGVEHLFGGVGDESDSEGDLPESNPHSRTSSAVGFLDTESKPASSAQDALREVMQGRKKAPPRSKALDTALMPPPSRSIPPELSIDTTLRNSDSPTTISDPGMLTTDHLTANTRCVCKNTSPSFQQQSMIQCGSCLNWLHTSCVGLNPLHLPTAYLCNYCTSSSSNTRSRRR